MFLLTKQAKLLQYVGIVIGLCIGSWIFHIGYYKYMGHPWSAINGPQWDTVNGVQVFFTCGNIYVWVCVCTSLIQSKYDAIIS